jgi:D-alanyl-D-alanine carboxypeptidase
MKYTCHFVLVFAAAQIACSAAAATTRDQIEAILSRPAIAANSWTMLIQNEPGTVTYYQRNPAMGQVPASNMKMLTTAAAFGLLGADYAFETRVYTNGPLSNGNLYGDLNLVSEHDITWQDSVFGSGKARKALDHIAAQLKARGLTNITGNVQCYGVCFIDRSSTSTGHNFETPATHNGDAATEFVAALQAQGITVSGVATGQSGFAPPGALFYTHKSTDLTYGGMPLRLEVACIPLMKVSHNVMADVLMRHIGYRLAGTDSLSAGAVRVVEWLGTSAGVSTQGLSVYDGSGLSYGNSVSARQAMTLFRYMWMAFPTWSTTLSIGCADGTLANRFCTQETAGVVHAKTGSLSRSIGLSGYIQNIYTSRRFFFSIIANHSSGIDQTATRQAIDEIVGLFGVPELSGVDPDALGKGDWIWRLPESITAVGAADLQGLINYEKSRGMKWLAIKAGDGNTSWNQFTTNVVAQCQAAGLKVFAWAYAYGGTANPYNPSDVPGEINVAVNALSLGADGFIINAESEYEALGMAGAPSAAEQYCQGIRSAYPNTFLAHAPLLTFNSVRTNLNRSFGRYCDAVMPQAYYHFQGLSVPTTVNLLNSHWTAAQNVWRSTGYPDAIKPIAPIGWGATPSVGSDIVEFVNLLKTSTPATEGGYRGVSFWSCQSHTTDIWNGIESVSIGLPVILIEPTFLNALPVSGTRIDLSWVDNSSNETGFKVESRSNPVAPWTQIGTVGANVTGYICTNLSPMVTYYFRVRAYNANGDSAYSNVATATTANSAPQFYPVANQIVNVLQTLTVPLTAFDSDPPVTNLISDFESYGSGTAVLFQAPNYSGSTSAYLDSSATRSTLVAGTFPGGNPGAGGRVLKASWSFLSTAAAPWVRLTTFNAPSISNPVISFDEQLQFDVYTDRPLAIGLGCRETSVPAGASIGSNGGTVGGIEWAGVNGTISGTPTPIRSIPANTWTNLSFNLSTEPVVNFAGGNGILATGLGTLEHLAVVGAGGSGAYNVYFDRIAVVRPNRLTYSLEPGAPIGAVINPTNGVFTWTPSASQGPEIYSITARVTDNGTPPLSDLKTFQVTVTRITEAVMNAQLTNGVFELQFPTDPGVLYLIQTSTNMIDWETVMATNASSASIKISEPVGSSRFYRALTE